MRTSGLSRVSPESKPSVRWRSQECSSAQHGIDRPSGDLARFVNVFGLFETCRITGGFQRVQIRYDAVLPYHRPTIDEVRIAGNADHLTLFVNPVGFAIN